jgi:TfoX/Sxy family transcriptional regulator of competence genes
MTAKPANTWRKAPDDLVARFAAALPDEPRIERRKMFGYPCAFVNGNLFTGLHQDSLIVRLPETDRAEAVDAYGAQPFMPMPGRSMREYVVLPARIVADADALSTWLQRALQYALALPGKQKKSSRKTKSPIRTSG